MKNIFSFKRFYYFIRYYLITNAKALSITAAALFIILLFFSLLGASNKSDNNNLYKGFTQILILTGVVLTGLSLNNTNSKPRKMFYLSIPCSTFEKYFGIFFISTVGFCLVFILLYFLYYHLFIFLSHWWFQRNYSMFDPFSASCITAVGYYLIFHSVFFLGASSFGRNSLGKTILSLIIIGAAFAFIAYVFVRIIFYAEFKLFPEVFKSGYLFFHRLSPEFQHFINNDLKNGLLFVLKYILAPYCWVLSFFKLKEMEV
jgi:hypothetical protein